MNEVKAYTDEELAALWDDWTMSESPKAQRLRATIAARDRRLAKYKAALDAAWVMLNDNHHTWVMGGHFTLQWKHAERLRTEATDGE